jgi:hypothetical protein
VVFEMWGRRANRICDPWSAYARDFIFLYKVGYEFIDGKRGEYLGKQPDHGATTPGRLSIKLWR